MPRTPKPRSTHWNLTRHAVDTSRLIEVRADSAIWRELEAGHLMKLPDLSGAILKITPPAGLAESIVVSFQATLTALGARAIRRMPAPPDDRVKVTTAPTAAKGPRTFRQVVMDRAKRATVVSDPKALIALLTAAMDEGEKR